jgi:hypothetical protein
MYFLPEHPYTLEAFALRNEPLLRERTEARHDTVDTSRGLLFRFRQRPWFVHARLTDDETDSGSSSSHVRRYGADATYLKDFGDSYLLTLNGGANPTRFDNSLGLEGDSNEYTAGGTLNIRTLRLESSLTKSNRDQDDPTSGTQHSDFTHWDERLTAFLPWKFRGEFYYRIQDRESDYRAPDQEERRLSDDDRQFQFTLVHRLFESLDSNYVYLHDSRNSLTGNSIVTTHSLSTSYIKSIPRGRVLASMNLSRSDTESEGRTDVIDEPHPSTLVSPPGFFRLALQQVDRDTIAIFATSPVSPFGRVRLVENVDYTLTAIAETFDVTIIALPLEFPLPASYDFFAVYSLKSGDFTIRYDTRGYNASVELLNRLLTPYYSYLAVRSDVLSGTFPGTPGDSTTNTVGLTVEKGPWRGTGEYQKLDWEISPYDAWRGEVQYIGPVWKRGTFYGTVTYLDKYYPEGSSKSLPEPYSDKSLSASGNLRLDIPAMGMVLSTGTAYARWRGLTESDSYSANATLVWRIGRIDLTAGANAYWTDTTAGGSGSNERMHQYYFVRIRREFF